MIPRGKFLAFTISAHNPYERLAQKVFSTKWAVTSIMPVAQASSLWAKLEKTTTISTGQRLVPLN
jgi:hypothetical protein